jgi:hypothetical protein
MRTAPLVTLTLPPASGSECVTNPRGRSLSFRGRRPPGRPERAAALCAARRISFGNGGRSRQTQRSRPDAAPIRPQSPVACFRRINAKPRPQRSVPGWGWMMVLPASHARSKNPQARRQDLSATQRSRAIPGKGLRARGRRFFGRASRLRGFPGSPGRALPQNDRCFRGIRENERHRHLSYARSNDLYAGRQDLSVTRGSRAMPGKGLRARGGRFFGRAGRLRGFSESPGRALPQNDRFFLGIR